MRDVNYTPSLDEALKLLIGDIKSGSDTQPVYKYPSHGLFHEQKKHLIEEDRFVKRSLSVSVGPPGPGNG